MIEKAKTMTSRTAGGSAKTGTFNTRGYGSQEEGEEESEREWDEDIAAKVEYGDGDNQADETVDRRFSACCTF